MASALSVSLPCADRIVTRVHLTGGTQPYQAPRLTAGAKGMASGVKPRCRMDSGWSGHLSLARQDNMATDAIDRTSGRAGALIWLSHLPALFCQSDWRAGLADC
jgi:hypothetical protein